MADEATTQTQTGGQATDPSSSQAGSQQTSQAGSAASGGASTQTQTSQAGTATRPDWLPEQFWDTGKNEIKGGDFRKSFDELSTFKAAEDVRKNTLPKTADEYKVELPKEFKVPEGLEFAFDEKDPLLGRAREIAHQRGLGQDAFTEILGLYAGARVGEAQQLKAARDAEVGKLGPTASARIDAVTTWMKGMVGEDGAKALSQMLVTAGHVQAFESLITKFTSQGAGGFKQNGRDQQSKQVDKATYDSWSIGQRLNYARTGDPDRVM